jgi:hypothetical protein
MGYTITTAMLWRASMNHETKVLKPFRKSPVVAPTPAQSEAARKAKVERLFRNLTQAKWPLSPEMLRPN